MTHEVQTTMNDGGDPLQLLESLALGILESFDKE